MLLLTATLEMLILSYSTSRYGVLEVSLALDPDMNPSS